MGIGSMAAAQQAAAVAQKEALKKGKTKEQKMAIEFLFNIKGGCLSKAKSYHNMQEYIAHVQGMCQNLNVQARAMQKIGLDPSQIQEIPPITFSSFIYDDDCLIRVEDEIAVSSQYSITCIFFSGEQMFTYKYIFDTTSDNTWEYTKDFFYTDITCFSTLHRVREKITIESGCGCLKSEDYNKHLFVDDVLEIIVPGATYAFSMRSNPTLEQSIQAAKAMLREKKYSK